MKLFAAIALLAAGGFGAYRLCGGSCPLQLLCHGSEGSTVVCSFDEAEGRYVEARTASVFAGACHYNGELQTAGREAVLAWRLRGGEVDGVEVVAVVAADRNLAEAGAKRRSVVYLDEDLAPGRRDTALEWLRRRHGDALGEIVAVKTGDVRVDLEGDGYDVRVGELVELRGAALPDRGCCSMPSEVWYEPQVDLADRLVGSSEVFAFRDPVLGPVWTRKGNNDAFLGDVLRRGRCIQTQEPEVESAFTYTIF